MKNTIQTLLGCLMATAILPGVAMAQTPNVPPSATPDQRGRVSLPALEIFTGRVTRVNSANSLTVTSGKKPVLVRLNGVDAPPPGDTLSASAKQFLNDQVANKAVRVEVRQRDDVHHLVVADVFILGDPDRASASVKLVGPRPMDPTGARQDLPKGYPNTRGGLPKPVNAVVEPNLAVEMVRAGFAKPAVARGSVVEKVFSDAEAEARENKRGVWSSAAPR